MAVADTFGRAVTVTGTFGCVFVGGRAIRTQHDDSRIVTVAGNYDRGVRAAYTRGAGVVCAWRVLRALVALLPLTSRLRFSVAVSVAESGVSVAESGV